MVLFAIIDLKVALPDATILPLALMSPLILISVIEATSISPLPDVMIKVELDDSYEKPVIPLIGTELEFLHSHRKSFLTYSVVRSYLGLARRDARHFYSSKTESDKIKRLKHTIRGYIYARDMISGDFDFSRCNLELLDIPINHTSSKQIKEYDIKISLLRNELTNKFNSKTLGLPQHIDVGEGIKITSEFLNYCKSREYKEKMEHLKDFDLTEFINSFENWVEY